MPLRECESAGVFGILAALRFIAGEAIVKQHPVEVSRTDDPYRTDKRPRCRTGPFASSGEPSKSAFNRGGPTRTIRIGCPETSDCRRL
jgi:hypothetical protein